MNSLLDSLHSKILKHNDFSKEVTIEEMEELIKAKYDNVEKEILKTKSDSIKTVICGYKKLANYCNKIGREHIISITSSFAEHSFEHFYTIVYDTPNLILGDGC